MYVAVVPLPEEMDYPQSQLDSGVPRGLVVTLRYFRTDGYSTTLGNRLRIIIVIT